MVQGCANSDITYNMGQTNVANFTNVRLYQNNGGVPGALVRDIAENPANTHSGSFSSVPPGNYLLVFSNINYLLPTSSGIYLSANSANSVARNTTGFNSTYQVPVTVDPYVQTSFGTTLFYCGTGPEGTAIINITGKPIGFIRAAIWPASANPDTDTALQEQYTTNVTQSSFTFSGLPEGNYFIRVITQCGYTEQMITMASGAPVFPNPVASEEEACPGKDITLSISLPPSLFTIKWYEGTTQIGTGNSITVVPLGDTIYSVSYQLTGIPACSTISGSGTIAVKTVPIHPASGTPENFTKMGISVLSKKMSTWPENIPNGFITLESKEKGLVLTRVSHVGGTDGTPVSADAIADPKEGMLVYDIQDKCVKMYNGEKWNCIQNKCRK